MRISIIVAKDRNNAIGKDNSLPWHLRDDLQIFKRTTTGHTILMGRKTYDSIGHALPNRMNLVLSHQKDLVYPDATVCNSYDEVLKVCQDKNVKQLFIIGGAHLFNEFMSKADILYITDVQADIMDADVFLEQIDFSAFDKIYYSEHQKNEQNDFDFTFNIYLKK